MTIAMTTVGEQIKALEEALVLVIRIKGGWVTLNELKRGHNDPDAKAEEPVTGGGVNVMPWAGVWCPIVTRWRVTGWQAVDLSEDMGLPLYGPAGDRIDIDEAQAILAECRGQPWADLRELDDEDETPDDGQRILLEVLRWTLGRAEAELLT